MNLPGPTRHQVLLAVPLLLWACGGEEADLSPTKGSGPEGVASAVPHPEPSPPPTSAAPACTVGGRSHTGLGGAELGATLHRPMNGDRARTKPFSALLTEYARVLGPNNVPQRLEDLGPTFGLATTRWFLEPIPSAVFVQTAFEVAFEGCSKFIGSAGGNQGNGTYDVPPTLATASTECAGWAKRFWSRDATPEQIQACAQVALQTTRETYGRSGKDLSTRDTSPSRRWAYACASVLTATPFLTY